MNSSVLQVYDLLEERVIPDVHATGLYFRHKKSGARIAVLSNDDENKVFTIGFRTPPEDSTGLPHILEHSVLCGSKNFPAKDPFVELVKGSLNTFLNAMTYPDKTVYPVASCNDKDFQNLMHVYMDAVLLTNIYQREEIFRQEGWHYELDSLEGEITYNGVVYNEMKGAFSSPESVLEREILNSLYPDTPYANESGGNPENIPELKYSQFLGFHSKYYHPSNSYIYLYGNMDVTEKLLWLDEQYLSKYDILPIASEIPLQRPFDKMQEVVKEYSITMEESEKDNTYLSYNKAIGCSNDVTLAGAFQVLEYVLLSAPGAPLKKALLDAGIGKDILGSYDNGVRQPMFSVIAKNANEEQKQAFVEIVEQVLKDAVEQGLDKVALEAAINYYDFRYREADYGSYSAGLMYGLDMFNTWLYADDQPFDGIELLGVYEFLKEQVQTDYFEKLIQKYLLDNTHGSIVMIRPKKGLTAENEQRLREKLAQYKASLDTEELQQLVDSTKALKAYQMEPSTKEELEAIPLLKREDLRKEILPLHNQVRNIDGVKTLVHEYFTNGIAYHQFLFDMKQVPGELLCYAGLLKAVLGYVDTEHYEYNELFNEINRHTGGIGAALDTLSCLGAEEEQKVSYPKDYQFYFTFSAKVLYQKQDVVFTMLDEILHSSKLEDTKRLYEIVAQQKSSMQMHIQGSGHGAALRRASACFSSIAYISDCTGGIAYYEFLKDLEENFQEKKDELVVSLKKLMKLIFCKENLIVDYIGEEKGYEDFAKGVQCMVRKLEIRDGTQTKTSSKDGDSVKAEEQEKPFAFVPCKKNEGFRTASKVQYVAKTGNFTKAGLPYTGALAVAKVILGYGYLWENVRVMNGAYGCMTGYGKNGDSYFVSYRDPKLKETLDIYDQIPQIMEQFDVDEREMTKYIIGTLSSMDAPMTPSLKGKRDLVCYLSGQSEEKLQKERDQVLFVTPEKIRELSKWMKAILEDGCICVIGSEEEVNKNQTLFSEVRTI